MHGIVSAVYASFFLAIGQTSLKKSYKDISPSVAFALDTILALFIWVPLSLFLGVDISSLPIVFLYAILSAILSEALYFYALSKGQLSITSVIISSYPLYTIFFSRFINHEILSTIQVFFVSITILGTLVTYLPSKFSLKELKSSNGILIPIIAAIGIGISDTFSKNIIDRTGDFTFLFALALVQVPIAIIFLKLEKENFKGQLTGLVSYKNIFSGSFFNVIATGLMWISFSTTMASIASPIVATSSAIVTLLAVLFLNEKINIRAILGLGIIAIGIIGITLTY